jgi:transcription elongation factor GreA
MNKNYISKVALEKYKTELDTLISEDRPKVLIELQEAREQGDLSENADYTAAKEKQLAIQGRINQIQEIIDNHILTDSIEDEKDVVSINNVITVYDFQEKEEITYKIVGSLEIDLDKNYISIDCPLAISVLKKKKGDIVEVKSIEKPYKLEILSIS